MASGRQEEGCLFFLILIGWIVNRIHPKLAVDLEES
jgi:hypothetical protein